MPAVLFSNLGARTHVSRCCCVAAIAFELPEWLPAGCLSRPAPYVRFGCERSLAVFSPSRSVPARLGGRPRWPRLRCTHGRSVVAAACLLSLGSGSVAHRATSCGAALGPLLLAGRHALGALIPVSVLLPALLLSASAVYRSRVSVLGASLAVGSSHVGQSIAWRPRFSRSCTIAIYAICLAASLPADERQGAAQRSFSICSIDSLPTLSFCRGTRPCTTVPAPSMGAMSVGGPGCLLALCRA